MSSLARAVDVIGIGQSAASRMLSVLERELNLRLSSHSRRQLELIEEGKEFLRRSQHVLDGLANPPEMAAEVKSVNGLLPVLWTRR